MDAELIRAAKTLLARCRARGWRIATAESCTGGLVAAALTEVAGSSDVFDRGWVTYSNEAKIAQLGVAEQTLQQHGAVSRAVAEAMAAGALARSAGHLAISVTGIAGPGGGTPHKPVGLVHFAATTRYGAQLHRECRFEDVGREAIRAAAVREALSMLQELVDAAGD